jgi:AcrR family transcriptional regulator
MAVVENAKEACRGRGRPQIRPDEETLALIVQAARAEFLARGYAGASMSAVAQRAGVSTKTVYRLAPCKADLFRNVVSERIGRFMLAIDEKQLGALDTPAALTRILTAFGQLTLDSEVIALVRLVLSESDRFPEIGQAFYEGAMVKTNEAMAAWLKEQGRKGLLDLDDPYAASEMLRGMMIMEPQRAAMLGQRPAPTAQEIEARAKACAALFLRGAGRRAVSC